MIRILHRWPGLIAALLLTVLALSGAVLSVLPAVERVAAMQKTQSVADLTTRIMATHPTVEQIRRAPSGRITAYWFENGKPGAAVIDPVTGLDMASGDPSPLVLWITELHRSLFLGDAGRYVTAAAALAMLILAATGTALIARRMGGWNRWFRRSRGPLTGRIHLDLARFAVVGLILSAATGLWMTASTFGLLPDQGPDPALPTTSGQLGATPGSFALLQITAVAALRELTFPYPGDATDVFSLKTNSGTALIDQGNGAVLAQTPLTTWQRVSETIYMAHTGRGPGVIYPLIALILGAMAAALPMMAVTGTLTWWNRRRSRPRLRGNAAVGAAETILLVASENGSTWGFAAVLHSELVAAGQKVHAAPLANFDPARYIRASRLIILAATYGDGDAPHSARNVLADLAALPHPPVLPLSILGFGDRSFPGFCAFAHQIAAATKTWPQLLPLYTVDRQSPQDFARWGRALGAQMGLTLNLVHLPEQPAVHALSLTQHTDFGAEVQAPTAILRFQLPPKTPWQRLTGGGFSRFQAGDLFGILPQGCDVPRFYSLASSSADGFAEICVRKHPGGLCSTQLLDLGPGDTVRAFIRRNPDFRPNRGRTPVILIGAGTGIGPLAGFIRANRARRPLHLFFGTHHPQSDLLYGSDLSLWAKQGRLSSLTTAFSRTKDRLYVQDALRRDAQHLSQLITQGAQILVCGGREMALGVHTAMTEILAPMGLTPALLKAEGRYAEDVY
ncbi:MAG: PepSY domain-containing protein [Alphaproteobacteria bacterium]